MTRKLDRQESTDLFQRFLKPLVVGVDLDAITERLVIHVFDETGTRRLLPPVTGETMRPPIHPADLGAAIGSIQDTLPHIPFVEQWPAADPAGLLGSRS